MAETIEYEQFQPTDEQGANPASPADLSRLSDVPMELSVEIGRTHMTVGETLDLRVGSVVALERLAGEMADLLVNGSAVARGEVVVIDEQYGLRIAEILDGSVDHGLEQAGVSSATTTDTEGADAAPAQAEDGEGSPAEGD